jgi:repressor LexA
VITKKQRSVLVFIERYIEDHGGVSPSFEDILAETEIKSKQHVQKILISLARNGFIRRLPHRARAIEVLTPVAIRENYRFDDAKKELVAHG